MSAFSLVRQRPCVTGWIARDLSNKGVVSLSRLRVLGLTVRFAAAHYSTLGKTEGPRHRRSSDPAEYLRCDVVDEVANYPPLRSLYTSSKSGVHCSAVLGRRREEMPVELWIFTPHALQTGLRGQ